MFLSALATLDVPAKNIQARSRETGGQVWKLDIGNCFQLQTVRLLQILWDTENYFRTGEKGITLLVSFIYLCEHTLIYLFIKWILFVHLHMPGSVRYWRCRGGYDKCSSCPYITSCPMGDNNIKIIITQISVFVQSLKSIMKENVGSYITMPAGNLN